jgi:SSS family solute:Na+ symporter
MAQNFWTAIFAWVGCFTLTVAISLLTTPRAEEELKGLVYSLTAKPEEGGLKWYQRPATLAVIVLVLLAGLNLIFW